MCGIGGVWDAVGEGVRLDLLHRMASALVHRGPDGGGFLLAGHPTREPAVYDDRGGQAAPPAPLGLLHRRLSIVDRAGGAQPIANEDGTRFVVCNGEIYNHLRLRSRLEAAGHRFSTQSDSEVILHLFEEYGPDGVTELDGIFAFAVWDGPSRALFLARDRLGVKPLYVTRAPGGFAFASEVKAFLPLPWFRVAVDPYAIAEHFTFQNTFGDRTFFDGVQMLAPGHHLTVTVESDRVVESPGCFWQLQYAEDHGPSLEAWGAEIREVFADVVTSQLMSEVPVGSFLSGGMDTGAITAVAGRHLDPLHTFTCGFDLSSGVSEAEENLFDERLAARSLAESLGTVHHDMVVRPGDMVGVLPRVVWHLDEPRVGISYQNFLINQLVASNVTVVLSGVGGDELFGGYGWRYERVADWGLEADFNAGYYALWQRMVPAARHHHFFSDGLRSALGDFTPLDSLKQVLNGPAPDDPVHRAMWFDTKTFLHGLLVVEDKLSMAHSVESRVPFTANALLDLVVRIPAVHKFRNGETKIVLREAFRHLLPDGTLHGPKVGFTPPDATWYRGPMASDVEGLLLADRSLQRGWFRPEGVRAVVGEHQSGARNHRFLLWSLMAFEWWCRTFLDGEHPCGPAG